MHKNAAASVLIKQRQGRLTQTRGLICPIIQFSAFSPGRRGTYELNLIKQGAAQLFICGDVALRRKMAVADVHIAFCPGQPVC